MQNTLFKKNKAKLNTKKRELLHRKVLHNYNNDLPIPVETLTMIESSVKNMKAGIVFGPIDLSEFENISGILKGKVSDDIDRHSLREERIFSKYEAID